MKFELFKGLILLPVIFEYGTKKIETQGVVDTGSAGTALDINLLGKLDFSRKTRLVEIEGIGGTQEVAIQTTEAVSFCGERASNFEVEFGDIATAFGFYAIVGSNLLDFLGVHIDYKLREIEISGK